VLSWVLKGQRRGGTPGRSGSPSEGEARARVSLAPYVTVTVVSGLGRGKDIKKWMNASFILPEAGNSISSARL